MTEPLTASSENAMHVCREFTVGDRVRFRDRESEAWGHGTITRTEPPVQFRGKMTPRTDNRKDVWNLSGFKFVEKGEV